MGKKWRILSLVLCFMLAVNMAYVPVSAADVQNDGVTDGLSNDTNNNLNGDLENNDPNGEPGNDNSNGDSGNNDQDGDLGNSNLNGDLGNSDSETGNTNSIPQNPTSENEDTKDEAGDAEEEADSVFQEPVEYIANLKASAKGLAALTLKWEIKDSEFSGYKIFVYEDADKEKIVKEEVLEGAAKTSYDVTGLTSGKIYYVSVIPYVKSEAKALSDDVESESDILGVEKSIPVMILETPKASIKAGDACVTVSWDKIAGATSYYIIDRITGKVVQTVTTTSITFTGLRNNVMCSYWVQAIGKVDNNTSVYSGYSKPVSARPVVTKPGKTTLKITVGSKAFALTWKKVSGATSYKIYRYDSKGKKWMLLKTTTGTSYTNKGLKSGRTYKYRVYAVRTSGGASATGSVSNTVSGKAKVYLTSTVSPMKYKARITSKAKLFKTKTSKKVVKTIKAGTKVTVLSRGSRCKIKLSNGKVYYANKKKLRFLSSVYSKKDYTPQKKEAFVNRKGYKSKTKYLVWISQYTQRVNIFKGSKGKWKLVRTCVVGTGTASNPTPQGVFKIYKKSKGFFYRYTYEKPAVFFKSLNSFHSRIYRYNGTLSDGRIGKPISHGCVRMYNSDINYIYKKCPKGTTVVSY